MRRSRKLRWTLWILGGTVLLLGIAILLLPAILSASWAEGPVLSVLERRMGVPVEAEDLSFSWTGPQDVRGLRVGAGPEGERLLDAPAMRIENDLLGLLFSRSKPIDLRVEKPFLSVHRDRQGRFNFEPLRESAERRRDEARERKPREEADARPVRFTLEDGRVLYRDDLLETSSDLRDIDLRLALDRDGARLEGGAAIHPPEPGSVPGALSVNAEASGLAARSFEDLQIAARAEARDVDLRPYRGLLVTLLGFDPPPEPVNGEVRVEKRGGEVAARARLAAGFLEMKEATLSLPLEPGGAPARLETPISLDLAGLTRSVGSKLRGEAGASGRLEGTARVTAPISLRDVRTDGAKALRGLSLAVEAKATDLEVRGPEAGQPPLLAAAKPGEPVSLRLAIDGALEGGEDLLSSIEGKGSLELSGGLKGSGAQVDGLRARVVLSGGVLELEEGEASVNEGKVRIEEAVLGLPGSGRQDFRLAIEAEGVEANYELSHILAYVVPFLSLENRRAELTGAISGSFRATGEGASRPELERSMRGEGKLRIREGRIAASRVFGDLAKVLGADLAAVLFSEIGSDFRIGDGRIQSDRVYLKGGKKSQVRELGLQGSTGLDGSLNYSVELSVLEEAIGDRKIREALEQARKLGLDTLPLQLGGNLAAPRLALKLDLKPRIPDLKDIPGLEDLPIPDLKDLPFPFPGREPQREK